MMLFVIQPFLFRSSENFQNLHCEFLPPVQIE